MNRYCLFVVLIYSLVCVSGCETLRFSAGFPTKEYSLRDESTEPIEVGRMIYKTQLFSKEATLSDIAIYGGSVSGLFETVILMGATYKTLHWEGFFKFDDMKQPCTGLYKIIYTDSPISSSEPETVYDIDFLALPDYMKFKCKNFERLKIISPKDMPYTIATFKVNNKLLKVNCTIMSDVKYGNLQTGLDSVYLVNSEIQRFEIVDETNMVFANSDINSYRIFKTSPEVTKSDLKNILGMVWVIQRICYVK